MKTISEATTKKTSLKHILWDRPKLGLRGGAKKASFLELFFDLSIVVAVGVIANKAGEYYTIGPMGWVYWIGAFYIIFSFWVSMVIYMNKFYSYTLKHRFIIFISIIPIGLLTVGFIVTSNWFLGDKIFRLSPVLILGFVISRIIILYLYVEVWYTNRKGKYANEAKRSYLTMGLSNLYPIIISLIIIGLTTSEYPTRIVNVMQGLFLSVIIWEVVWATWILYHRKDATKLNTDHLVERFSLFIIIVLGQCMISAVYPVVNDVIMKLPLYDHIWRIVLEILAYLIMAFIILFLIWWTYMDRVPAFKINAKKPSKTIIYIWTNFFIIIGLMLLSSYLYETTLSDSLYSSSIWNKEEQATLAELSRLHDQTNLALNKILPQPFVPTKADINAMGQTGLFLTLLGITTAQLLSQLSLGELETEMSKKTYIAQFLSTFIPAVVTLVFAITIQYIPQFAKTVEPHVLWIDLIIVGITTMSGIIIWILGMRKSGLLHTAVKKHFHQESHGEFHE